MQANLGMQGGIDLLNNVYNLVHQQNYQFLDDRIMIIECVVHIIVFFGFYMASYVETKYGKVKTND